MIKESGKSIGNLEAPQVVYPSFLFQEGNEFTK